MTNNKKSNKPLISVIVPVYNAEKFLDKCISSILEQSYINLELILINDGSNDGSLRICNTYKERDRRIKVLSQKNLGVSHARNRGMDIAKGEWITFVDADDCISKIFIETLFNAAENESYVISASEFVRFKNDKELSKLEKETGLFSIQKLTIKDAVCFPKEKTFGCTHVNKLYHTSTLKDSQENLLRFNESIYYGEDQLFFYNALLNSKSLVYIHKPLYYYRENSDSATYQSWNPKRDTIMKAFEQILKIVEDYDSKRKFQPYIKYQKLCVSLFLLRTKKGERELEFEKHLRHIIFERFLYYLISKEVSLRSKIYAVGILVMPEWTIKCSKIYDKLKIKNRKGT